MPIHLSTGIQATTFLAVVLAAVGAKLNTSGYTRPMISARSFQNNTTYQTSQEEHKIRNRNDFSSKPDNNVLKSAHGLNGIPNSRRQGCTAYINSACPAGDRVIRGPDWKWGNQDSGNSIGTVTRPDDTGWCRVTWVDSGNSNNYRVGSEGKYDLCNAPATSSCTAGTSCSAHFLSSVVYKDQRYATLDAGDPFGIGVDCQDYWLAVPPGWELALPNADSIAVAAAYTWGTHLLVYADGTQIYTAHSDYYSSRGQTREWICCSDGQTALGTSDIGFEVNACARRVLLRACPAGKYSKATGATGVPLCVDCNAGKFSGVGYSTCYSSCQPGTYHSGVGDSKCFDCVSGKYSIIAGATACVDCDVGGCGQARACPSGTFGSSSGTSCTSCTPNSNSPFQSTSRTSCTCNAGYGGNAGTGTCTECVTGKYKSAAGNGDCTTIAGSATLRVATCRSDGCCRLEILYSGSWGTVCDDDWGDADTRVACRQMGCGGSSSHVKFGGGSGRIWMDEVGCGGTETSLTSCSFRGWGTHDCTHDEDVGVCCCGEGASNGGTSSGSSSSGGGCVKYRDSSCPSGDRVMRGPDWDWGDQDGNSLGTVTSRSSDSENWCEVTWDAGNKNSYRVGYNGAFDLCVADDRSSSSSSSRVTCAATGDRNAFQTCAGLGSSTYTQNCCQGDCASNGYAACYFCPSGGTGGPQCFSLNSATRDRCLTSSGCKVDSSSSPSSSSSSSTSIDGSSSISIWAIALPVIFVICCMGFCVRKGRTSSAQVVSSVSTSSGNNDVGVELGVVGTDVRREGRPDTFYHATTEENALRIQENGFVIPDGPGGLLGRGVYCTSTLKKATDYLTGPYGGVILELKIDLGNCKHLVENDPMMKTWQNHYDSAWAPFSAVNPSDTGKQENCVKDPKRIKVVQVIAGHTGELRRGGYEIINGKLRKGGSAAGNP